MEEIQTISDTKMVTIYEFMSLLNSRFPSMKLKFKIENKDQLLHLDVVVIAILPISWSLIFAGRILILTDLFLIIHFMLENTRLLFIIIKLRRDPVVKCKQLLPLYSIPVGFPVCINECRPQNSTQESTQCLILRFPLVALSHSRTICVWKLRVPGIRRVY